MNSADSMLAMGGLFECVLVGDLDDGFDCHLDPAATSLVAGHLFRPAGELLVVLSLAAVHAVGESKEAVMARRAAVYKRCGCRSLGPCNRMGTRCPRLGERGHGTWYFSLELPCGPNGRRHRVRRGGFRSRGAAEQARAYLLGADVDPGRSAVTVGQWLDIWLEMCQSLSFNTRRLYTQHINTYLKPYLGSVPLRSLTTARVQAMFVALAGRTPIGSGRWRRRRSSGSAVCCMRC
ncbi:hypothetical protein [Amycolatopsis kentuckyensis]|uniref:hypothetical protein n=1 Tax=Amycolatopsis kentuckyensis TaxID=218823 RepID=UPI003567F5BE